jgi:hypothetical protein
MRFGFVMTLVVSAVAAANAASLTPDTTAAWDRYLQTVDARTQARLDGRKCFLWVDEEPSRKQQVQQGEILVWHPNHSGSLAIPHGLIHDWNGAAFIPNVSVADVLAVLQDYGRYQDFYKPAVIASKPLSQMGDNYTFSMLWMQKALFVTAAVNANYHSTYFQIDDKRWYSITRSTEVREIQNYGDAEQLELPPGIGHGFLWKVYSGARYEQRDGGVYVEMEGLVLSRDIPVSLRWLVTPVVERLARNSVAASLRQTRDAVCQRTEAQTASDRIR